jgi:hypothetical protein
MIETGKTGNSGRDVMQRLLKEMETVTGDSAYLARGITEIDTEFGYWWCYQPASHHPGEAIEAMIHIAKAVADAEAHNSGKTYVVGSVPFTEATLYVFAARPSRRAQRRHQYYVRLPRRRQAGSATRAAAHAALTMAANHPLPRQRKDSPTVEFSLPLPTDEPIDAARRNGRGLMRKLPDSWACPCCDRSVREIV